MYVAQLFTLLAMGIHLQCQSYKCQITNTLVNQMESIIDMPRLKKYLEYSYSKYCNLIGQLQGTIFIVPSSRALF